MSLLAFIHFSSNAWDSPFSVPIAGCAMVACIVVASMASANRKRELQSQERLAAIAKGVPVPPTEEELAIMHGKPSTDSTRRRGNTRRAGIVLLGCAVGLILFFIALATVLQIREVPSGAAAGLIPLGIGIGFLVDARIQSRELEESANTPPNQH
jgi:Domain of unknown function (DUF6249)